VDEIFVRVRQSRIPYALEPRSVLDRLAGAQHQGVVAYLAARSYADFAPLLSGLDPERAFLVFLDAVQDPHNLGAIVRSAHAAGADGVILQERHAAGLTGAAVKASAGATEHIPVCRVPNLRKAVHQAKESGLWIAGLDAGGDTDFTHVDFRGPCGIVVGSEGRGLRRLVRAACDFAIRIPMARQEVGSFNASVAAGLVLYEVFRQRRPD
jgi:23S rRNA (guanosine2251-2'-O)-methyltransferase